MSENVSRRRALSVLGAALGLALAPMQYEAKAQTAGIGRRQHRRADRRQRRTGPPATAPAEANGAGPGESTIGISATQHTVRRYRSPTDRSW